MHVREPDGPALALCSIALFCTLVVSDVKVRGDDLSPAVAGEAVSGQQAGDRQDSRAEPMSHVDFARDVAPLFSAHCVRCHNDQDRNGGLSLSNVLAFHRGGDSGAVVVPKSPETSHLLQVITPNAKGRAAMPEGGVPLTNQEIDLIRHWIAAGASWPAELKLTPETWWSLRPLQTVEVPPLSLTNNSANAESQQIIDRFLLSRLKQQGLTFSPEADRRTLIRRLTYDLTGLPPTAAEVDAFINDPNPQAYDALVDRLLASPRFGERQARHWLDVVHYGESHGYDKDKLRPNAWPYRDYVIRAMNQDKPFGDFIREQVAGDRFSPDSIDGNDALGFLAAGPWDFIGHAEVPESKIDGKIARHLDRDDVVRNTLETFCSLTVGCAQCHDHKFDPISQVDYYRLQAVFAAIDRADRRYDTDPEVREHRRTLMTRREELSKQIDSATQEFAKLAGDEYHQIEKQLAQLEQGTKAPPAEHGYHSSISPRQEQEKWVQVELAEPAAIRKVVIQPCHDDFNGIGAGFGFPLRYRVEAAKNAEFTEGVTLLVDATQQDSPNPGIAAISHQVTVEGLRHVRVTATRLAHRKDDFIFALAEVQLLNADGTNLAVDRPVTALDSIEAPIRWRKQNLVDGIFPESNLTVDEQNALRERRGELIAQNIPAELTEKLASLKQQLGDVDREVQGLPQQRSVYAGTVHSGSGSFAGTGASGGKPRPVMLLERGDVTRPAKEMSPGTVQCLPISGELDLPDNHTESDRRAALARWLSHPDNPLVWRSIVNRIWQSHFGTGLVETPNDFGRMGGLPSHPELLDWLARDFRDQGESLKRLHRQIVTSQAYRQQSQVDGYALATTAESIDPANRLLWRQQRRRLDAEEIRDSLLSCSGLLNLQMGGPSFRDFVIEKPEHSPHYEYDQHDPLDPKTHRRSIYRTIIRSQTDPFMTVLDCADPSMQVPRRNETISPQQALTMLNSRLSLAIAQVLAKQVMQESDTPAGEVDVAFRRVLGRQPSSEEHDLLVHYRSEHGTANMCRVILNLNEFVFVD